MADDDTPDTLDCPECGAAIRFGETKCPECGAEFEIEESEELTCPACDAPLPGIVEKCPSCGVEFEVDGEEAGPPAEPGREPVRAREPEEEPETPAAEKTQRPAPAHEAPAPEPDAPPGDRPKEPSETEAPPPPAPVVPQRRKGPRVVGDRTGSAPGEGPVPAEKGPPPAKRLAPPAPAAPPRPQKAAPQPVRAAPGGISVPVLTELQQYLLSNHPGAVEGFEQVRQNMLKATVARESLKRVCTGLKQERGFEHVSSITAVDWEDRFECVYHLTSYSNNIMMELRATVPADDPVIDTVSDLWFGANWHEREAWDLMGIRFAGHDNLTRVLNPVDFEHHPLRKDFPLEGPEEGA